MRTVAPWWPITAWYLLTGESGIFQVTPACCRFMPPNVPKTQEERQQGWGSKHEQKNSGVRFSSVQIIHGMLSGHVPGLMRDKRWGENTSHHSVISSNKRCWEQDRNKDTQVVIFWTIQIQKHVSNMKTCSISSIAWLWQSDWKYPFSQLDIWLDILSCAPQEGPVIQDRIKTAVTPGLSWDAEVSDHFLCTNKHRGLRHGLYRMQWNHCAKVWLDGYPVNILPCSVLR